MAVAVAEERQRRLRRATRTAADLHKVSTTEIATHPVFSPSGKLAWVGGGGRAGNAAHLRGRKARVAVRVRARPRRRSATPKTASDSCSPCPSAGDHQDLVMTNERGGGIARLTQNQGSNTYPGVQLRRPPPRVLLDAKERSRAGPLRPVAEALHVAAALVSTRRIAPLDAPAVTARAALRTLLARGRDADRRSHRMQEGYVCELGDALEDFSKTPNA